MALLLLAARMLSRRPPCAAAAVASPAFSRGFSQTPGAPGHTHLRPNVGLAQCCLKRSVPDKLTASIVALRLQLARQHWHALQRQQDLRQRWRRERRRRRQHIAAASMAPGALRRRLRPTSTSCSLRRRASPTSRGAPPANRPAGCVSAILLFSSSTAFARIIGHRTSRQHRARMARLYGSDVRHVHVGQFPDKRRVHVAYNTWLHSVGWAALCLTDGYQH